MVEKKEIKKDLDEKTEIPLLYLDDDINTNDTSTPPPTPAAATSPPLDPICCMIHTYNQTWLTAFIFV